MNDTNHTITEESISGRLIHETREIQDRHEYWWRDPEAQQQMKSLWDNAIADSGVFLNQEVEILFDNNGCKAEVYIGGARGVYAFGCSFSYPSGGFGHSASISGWLFTSRDAARRAGVERLLRRLPDLFPHEEGLRGKIEKVRASLKSLLVQPSLF